MMTQTQPLATTADNVITGVVTTDYVQRLLPFEPSRERARLDRVERLLSGQLGRHVRPASELAFNYPTATALAKAKSTLLPKGSSA